MGFQFPGYNWQRDVVNIMWFLVYLLTDVMDGGWMFSLGGIVAGTTNHGPVISFRYSLPQKYIPSQRNSLLATLEYGSRRSQVAVCDKVYYS